MYRGTVVSVVKAANVSKAGLRQDSFIKDITQWGRGFQRLPMAMGKFYKSMSLPEKYHFLIFLFISMRVILRLQQYIKMKTFFMI